jgi:hypothetical protein
MFATCFKLVSCLAYSREMKMETKCSSEKSMTFNGLNGVIYKMVALFTLIVSHNSISEHMTYDRKRVLSHFMKI